MDNVLRLPVRREPVRREPARPSAPGSVRRSRPEPLWREAVGRQLRAERAARGERIVDVADRAGIAPQYLSELERGVKDPSSEVLSAVSGALELSVLELTRRAGRRLAGRLDGPVCLAA
jgi:ribosome-binding protein aMBF1 (putative translation factor)